MTVKNKINELFELIEKKDKKGWMKVFSRIALGAVIALKNGIIRPILIISAKALNTIKKISNAKRILKCLGNTVLSLDNKKKIEIFWVTFTVNF